MLCLINLIESKKMKTNSYLDRDFHHDSCIEYDYETEYHCAEAGCRENNDYCRCSTIYNARVTKVHPDGLLNKIGKFDELTTYCVDRLLTKWKMYESGNWSVNTRGGYYGEEIDTIKFDWASKFEPKLIEMLALNNNKKIEYVLQEEYGYLLDIAKEKNWKIIEVPAKNLKFGSKTHYRKLDKEIVEFYKERKNELPKAICLLKNDKFEVIDGYHRSKANDKEMIKIICGE